MPEVLVVPWLRRFALDADLICTYTAESSAVGQEPRITKTHNISRACVAAGSRGACTFALACRSIAQAIFPRVEIARIERRVIKRKRPDGGRHDFDVGIDVVVRLGLRCYRGAVCLWGNLARCWAPVM